jgi:hypothetical protein
VLLYVLSSQHSFLILCLPCAEDLVVRVLHSSCFLPDGLNLPLHEGYDSTVNLRAVLLCAKCHLVASAFGLGGQTCSSMQKSYNCNSIQFNTHEPCGAFEIVSPGLILGSYRLNCAQTMVGCSNSQSAEQTDTKIWTSNPVMQPESLVMGKGCFLHGMRRCRHSADFTGALR